MLLALTDAVAAGVAYIAAYNLWSAQIKSQFFYLPKIGPALSALLWVTVGWIIGSYSIPAVSDLRRSLRTILLNWVLVLICLLGVFFIDPFRLANRSSLILWAPLSLALVLLLRLAIRVILRGRETVADLVLVGEPAAMRALWADLSAGPQSLYRLTDVIDPGSASELERLQQMSVRGETGVIAVGVRDNVSRELFQALEKSHENGAIIRSLADIYEEFTGRMLLDQLGHSWLMSVPMASESSHAYRAMKRGVDIAVSLAGLAVLVLLLIPIAPMQKFGGGSIFHNQLRIGKYGRPFMLRKLRTMRQGDDRTWTSEHDVRITRLGKFLRKTHVDELPQALNILRGEMSLVGPRPEQPHYVEYLQEKLDFYGARHVVRPGLTGWAQVSAGYLGGVEGAREKLSYDLYYIKHQSATLDMLVIARTTLVVLSLRGR